MDQNERASIKKCNQVLEQRFKEVIQKLTLAQQQQLKSKSKMTSLQQSLSALESEIQSTFINPYCRQNSEELGPCQAQALLAFLEAHLVEELYKPLLQAEIDRQLKKEQEEELEFQTIHEDLEALETEVESRRQNVDSKQQVIQQLQAQLAEQQRNTDELERKYKECESEVRDRKREIREEEERQRMEQERQIRLEEEERRKKEQRRIKMQDQEILNRMNTGEEKRRGNPGTSKKRTTNAQDGGEVEPFEEDKKNKKNENCAC